MESHLLQAGTRGNFGVGMRDILGPFKNLHLYQVNTQSHSMACSKRPTARSRWLSREKVPVAMTKFWPFGFALQKLLIFCLSKTKFRFFVVVCVANMNSSQNGFTLCFYNRKERKI